MSEISAVISVVETLGGFAVGYWISLKAEDRKRKHEVETEYLKELLKHMGDLIKPLLSFVVASVKNLGWLNLLVGFSGLISTLYIMAGYVITSYLAWFGLIPVFCGIACILRADGISKLP